MRCYYNLREIWYICEVMRDETIIIWGHKDLNFTCKEYVKECTYNRFVIWRVRYSFYKLDSYNEGQQDCGVASDNTMN